MVQDKHHPDQGQGPKFKVDIEGKLYDWDRPTITPAEIRQLGGLPADPVMEIDADNNERQLAEDEVVELKPGLGFSKKIRFRRGSAIVRPQSSRMVAEFELIRKKYPNAVYEVDTNGMEWVMVPDYPLPKEIWGRDKAHVAVKVHPAAYPANYPYGLYVEGPMQLLSGQPVGNYTPVSEPVPFPGQWGVFSWYVENWNPHADVEKGNNLARFIDSFAERFREGA